MTTPDFSKIFGSNATSTQQWSDANYLTGWGFLGQAPPPYQLFDDWFKNTDLKLKWIYENGTGGGGGGGTNKYIYTVNNTFTAKKAGTHNITAVAGGGGGTSCMGCGGGSGQSTSGYAVTLGIGDTISFTIGMGGSGSKVVGENMSLVSDGSAYAGANGGNTVITITKSGLPPQYITLIGGGGASCPSPSSIKYQAGIGENNGGIMNFSMYNSSTNQAAWTGGNGGSSIFGNGGSGGIVTFDNFQKIPAKNAMAYGAGGGGGGFRQVGTSWTYYWTAGGDGMQGCVIIEVA